MAEGPCLDEGLLAAFFEDRLAPAEATRLFAHVDGCGDCARLFRECAIAVAHRADASSAIPVADAVASPLDVDATPRQRPGAGGRPRETAPAPQASDFDGYRLVRPIGAGAMGQVYLGHDTLLDRAVAIKFIAGGEPDPATRERFRIEARAIARLQHPNVVAIHRVGELHGRPYLISEYIRGRNLAQLRLPLSYEQAVHIGVGLARGLAAAHRRGVLHRDLKPANAILDEDGEVKLVDFGLAKLDAPSAPAPPPATAPILVSGVSFASAATGKVAIARSPDATTTFEPPLVASSLRDASPRLTSPGAVVGTPAYMAPEMWMGSAATARSDIYSIGVMLFELCSGRIPHTEPSLEKLGYAVMTRDAPPLEQVATNVDARLAVIVNRCLRRDPEQRFATADELRDALEELVRPASAPPLEGNPYRGLRPFEAEHRALFFGRGRTIRDLVERLHGDSFVLVAGDSGVGKSSLCRAGVVPLVCDGGFSDKRQWTSLVMVPGHRPLTALRAALAPHLGESDDPRASNPHDIARALRQRHQRHSGLLIFIDQLEELVTLSDMDEAHAFAAFVPALLEAHASVRLIATARSDFLSRLAALGELGTLLSRALYVLKPLSSEGIREAIVGPAQQKGVRFESEALVDTLVSATAGAEGGLPLLQFALAELWEVRDPSSNVITAASLEQLGGVVGALARHADGVLESLRPAQRRQAQRLLAKLVTVEGTRARRSETELGIDDDDQRAALEGLTRGRLIVARESEEGTAFEIAHEALIRGWPTLHGWLEGAADSRALRQRLEIALNEWQRLGRPIDALLTERQLAALSKLDSAELTAVEIDFLSASRRALHNRRLRRQALIASAFVAVALVYGGVRLRARQELRGRIAAHLTRATTSLGEARQRDHDVEGVRARAFAAFDRDETEPAEQLWKDARAQAAKVDALYVDTGEALETALLLDGTRDDVKHRLVELLFERALLAERDHRDTERDELLRRMHLYDLDGEMQHRWDAPATLTIATTPPGAHLRIDRYVADDDQRRMPTLVSEATTPLAPKSLPPGSYLLTLTLAGSAEVRYPVLLARAERFSTTIDLPRADRVPAGFVYVPPGRFLYGSADEGMRRLFAAAPLHERTTGAFLIARHETTFAEWINFLEHLPPDEREKRLPNAAMDLNGSIHLRRVNNRWQLNLAPTTHLYQAFAGEPIRYEHRKSRATQDWLKFPVAGISLADANAFASWRRATDRTSGARLCRDAEWERASRGADDRIFPHGDTLAPDDANFDETYSKDPFAFGPDEVGSHPASRSPFGVEDTAGNVWEFIDASKPTLRGGSFYFGRLTNMICNRDSTEAETRDTNVGFRPCADVVPN